MRLYSFHWYNGLIITKVEKIVNIFYLFYALTKSPIFEIVKPFTLNDLERRKNL